MKKKDVEGMDLVLKGFMDFKVDGGDTEGPAPDSPADPVSDFVFRERWKIDPPGAKSTPERRPLNREEIAQSLANLQKHLNGPGFRSTKELVAKLAEAAREHLPEGNFTRDWFEAYAVGNQVGMRNAVQKLLAESKNEITEYARRSQDVSMQRGIPNAVVKKNGWTYKYDSAGSLQACFEGDNEPFIFAN